MTEINEIGYLALKRELKEPREECCYLEDMMNHISGGVYRRAYDEKMTILNMSESFFDLVGFTRQEVEEQFHNRLLEMVLPEDRSRIAREAIGLFVDGAVLNLKYRMLRKNSGPLWVLDQGKFERSPSGADSFCCVILEITKQIEEQEQLQLAVERYQIILDQTTDIIFEWDMRQDTLTYSSNWYKKYRYEPIRDQIRVKIPRSPNIHPDDKDVLLKILRNSLEGVPYSEVELRIRNSEGRFSWCRIRITVQLDQDHHPFRGEGVIVDIDSDKRQKQILMERARRDALTNLYNKAALEELVTEKMLEGRVGKEQALLIIDVDYFKKVNDTYGHLCGDSLLSDVAGALKSRFRAGDLVGRIGGDEFLVYLPEIASKEETTKRADSVLEALRALRPQAGAAPISCSIGIAQFPQRAIDYFALYKCADLALYQMKAMGRDGYLFYDPVICNGRIPCGLAKSAIGAIDSEREESEDEVGDKLAQYTFRMLYESIDVRTAVPRLLEIVGRAYDVSRVYIFEGSEDGCSCSNTFEWCNVGVSSAMEQLQNLSYKEDLADYLINFDENGIFYCSNIHNLPPELISFLAPQGVRSILQCAIQDDGNFKGYVGFDECKENRFWTKVQIQCLTQISHILSTFLLKHRLKERLARLLNK